MARTQILNGVVSRDGELRLDGRVDLASGPVRVVVTESPNESPNEALWVRLERTWSEQRARQLQSVESEAGRAADASGEMTESSEQMSPAARELQRRMSSISEDCYCAGWLSGLEFQLWSAVMNDPVEQGWWKVTQSDIDALRLLARQCGGWIVWDESRRDEMWVPIDEWLRRYEEHVANSAKKAK